MHSLGYRLSLFNCFSFSGAIIIIFCSSPAGKVKCFHLITPITTLLILRVGNAGLIQRLLVSICIELDCLMLLCVTQSTWTVLSLQDHLPRRLWWTMKRMQQSWRRKSWSPSRFLKKSSTFLTLLSGEEYVSHPVLILPPPPNSSFCGLANGTLLWPARRFASPNVVQPYLHLLKSYSKNTPHTNHCIARMLHRLAVNLKMDALLFQLSVFNLFNKILSDPAAAAYKVESVHEETRPPSSETGYLSCEASGRLDRRAYFYSFTLRSWWLLPNTCWTVSFHWRHKTTKPMSSCSSGRMSALYVRWLRATAMTGWCF